MNQDDDILSLGGSCPSACFLPQGPGGPVQILCDGTLGPQAANPLLQTHVAGLAPLLV